jgi:hypothetical protein
MVELVTRMMELKKQQARAPKKQSPSAKGSARDTSHIFERCPSRRNAASPRGTRHERPLRLTAFAQGDSASVSRFQFPVWEIGQRWTLYESGRRGRPTRTASRLDWARKQHIIKHGMAR